MWRGFVKSCHMLPPKVLWYKFPRYSFLLTDFFLQSPILLEHTKLWLISRVCEFSRFNSFKSRISIPQNGAFHPDFSVSAWSPGRDVSFGTCVQVTFVFLLLRNWVSTRSFCVRPSVTLADKQEWNYRSAFYISFLSVLTLGQAKFTSVDCWQAGT